MSDEPSGVIGMPPSHLNPHDIKQKLVGGPFDGREYNFGKFTYSPVVEIRWHRSNAPDELLLYEITSDTLHRLFIGSRKYSMILGAFSDDIN